MHKTYFFGLYAIIGLIISIFATIGAFVLKQFFKNIFGQFDVKLTTIDFRNKVIVITGGNTGIGRR